MIELLLNKGFIKTENPNEYKKDDWTVRWDSFNLEVYEDKGWKYYKGDLLEVNLEEILNEIM